MATFVCRVQFLDDTDPFNSTNFPEPTRPPLFTFREDIQLINQLAGVHRLLKAPQKVITHLFTLSATWLHNVWIEMSNKSTNKACGDKMREEYIGISAEVADGENTAEAAQDAAV